MRMRWNCSGGPFSPLSIRKKDRMATALAFQMAKLGQMNSPST